MKSVHLNEALKIETSPISDWPRTCSYFAPRISLFPNFFTVFSTSAKLISSLRFLPGTMSRIESISLNSSKTSVKTFLSFEDREWSAWQKQTVINLQLIFWTWRTQLSFSSVFFMSSLKNLKTLFLYWGTRKLYPFKSVTQISRIFFKLSSSWTPFSR